MTTPRELPGKWLAKSPVGDEDDEYSSGYDDALRHCSIELESALATEGDAKAESTRAAFERWIRKRHGYGTERWADSGEYRYHNTRDYWACWKMGITAALEVDR